MNNRINFAYLLFISFVAALGGFLYGYDTAVISGTVSQVTDLFQLDTLSAGWYVGCALVGSIAGVAVAGVLGDLLGRKRAMMLSALLFTSSAIGCALCTDFTSLVVWRIDGGVGIGIASIICPLYISELAAAEYRGRLVSLYQLAITIGFVGAYLVNYVILNYADSHVADGSVWTNIFVAESWRGMLGAETIPALMFCLVLFLIPESPRWLMAHNGREKATAIVSRIYTSAQAVSQEISSVSASLQSQTKAGSTEFSILMRPRMFKGLLIGVAIAILGQFMGVNAVLYYGPTIFQDAGLSGSNALFYQVIIGIVNTVTTVAALLIIDKVGRKQLVYWGVSGMILSLLLIAGYFTYGERFGIAPVWLLISFMLYIMCCAGSICAVVWVILSEMYPTKVRAVAMSIAGFSLWIGTYLVGQLTPWMLENLTPPGTFLVFAGMCVPYMIIMYRGVPETTGKTLEEIEKYWLNDPREAAQDATVAGDTL